MSNTRRLPLRMALTSLAVAFAAGGGCVIRFGHDGDGLKGSGKSVSDTRAVQAFQRLEVNGSTDVVVTAGGAPGVVVSGDDNIVPRVRTRVRDGVLVVDMEPGSYSTRARLLVTATTPRLEAIALHGSADVEAKGIQAERFEAEITGSGDLRAQGRASAVEASVTGSGDLHLYELQAARAKVRVSGSGDIDVSASEALDAGISGSGDIRYRGTPKVESSVSGSGSVERS